MSAPDELDPFLQAARRLGGLARSLRPAHVERALDAAAGALSETSSLALLRRLDGAGPDSPEAVAFLGALAVPETSFGRHPAQLAALVEEVLIPARDAGRPVRLWSAGCSTGEEAWTLAMLVADVLPPSLAAQSSVLGTDVDRRALELAASRRYRHWSVRGEVHPRLRRWLVRADDGWSVSPDLRTRVTFATCNLLGGWPVGAPATTGPFDAITFRNVIVYLAEDAVLPLVDRMRQSLLPGGVLVVAPAEVFTQAPHGMAAVRTAGGTFYRRTEPSALAVAPPSPVVTAAALRPANAPRAPLPSTRAAAGDGPSSHPDADGEHRCAVELDEAGDLDGALAAARRCTYLDPSHVPGLVLQAGLLARLGGSRRAAPSIAAARALVEVLDPGDTVPGATSLTVSEVRAALDAIEAIEAGGPP